MKAGDKFRIRLPDDLGQTRFHGTHTVFEVSDNFVIYRDDDEMRVIPKRLVLIEPERRYIARSGCVVCVSDGAPSHNDSAGWTFPSSSKIIRADGLVDFIPDGSCFEIKLIEMEKDEDN